MTPFCKNKRSYLVCRCVSILRYDTAALAVFMSILDRLLDAVIAVWYAIEDIFQVLCSLQAVIQTLSNIGEVFSSTPFFIWYNLISNEQFTSIDSLGRLTQHVVVSSVISSS